MELSHGQVVTRWCKFKGTCSPFTIPARLRICTHNLKNGFVLTDHNRKKIPSGSLQKGGKTVGIFNAAFIETGEIHASRTAAALQFSEHSSAFWGVF